MLGAEQAGLNAGRHALAWVLGQTDIWYLLYRCANYVSKGQGQSPSSVSILDNLFTLDDDNYQEEEDFNNQFLEGRVNEDRKRMTIDQSAPPSRVIDSTQKTQGGVEPRRGGRCGAGREKNPNKMAAAH